MHQNCLMAEVGSAVAAVISPKDCVGWGESLFPYIKKKEQKQSFNGEPLISMY